MNSGGMVAGAGTATSDSIPAYLSNGEYVVKADAVDQYGIGFFDQLNAQKFADGGLVNLPGYFEEFKNKLKTDLFKDLKLSPNEIKEKRRKENDKQLKNFLKKIKDFAGFSDGIISVPGPKGAGDIIPAMLSPGEAVIPSVIAQNPKIKPLISAMVSGKLQGFNGGTTNAQPSKNSQSQNKLNESGKLPSNTLIKSLTPDQKKTYKETLKVINTYAHEKDANEAIDKALKMGVPKELLGKALLKNWKDGMYSIANLKEYQPLINSLSKKESGTFFRGTGVSEKGYYHKKLGTIPPEMSAEIYKILTTLKGPEQKEALSKFIGKDFDIRTSSWSSEESIAKDFAKEAKNTALVKKDVVPFTIKTSVKDQDVIPVNTLFKDIYAHDGVPESERLFGGKFVISEISSSGITIEKVLDTNKPKPFANSKPFEPKVYVGGPSQDALRSNPDQVNNLLDNKPGVPQFTDEERAARVKQQQDAIERNKLRRSTSQPGAPIELSQSGTTTKSKQKNSEVAFSHITGDIRGQVEKRTIQELYDSNEFKGAHQQLLKSYVDAGMGDLPGNAYTSLGFDIPADINTDLAKKTSGKTTAGKPKKVGVSRDAYVKAISAPGSINTMIQMLMEDGMSSGEAIRTAHAFRRAYKEEVSKLGPTITDSDLASTTKKLLDTGKFEKIRPLSSLNVATRPTAATIRNFLSDTSATSDIQDYSVAKKILEKENIFLSAESDENYTKENKQIKIFKDSSGKIIGIEARDVDGTFTHVGARLPNGKLDMVRSKGGGRFGGYMALDRVKQTSQLKSALLPAQKNKIKAEAELARLQKADQVKNIESAGNTPERNAALEEVAARTKTSPVANQEPEQYARQLTKSSGYSFTPAPGIAGLYEKADGTKVFVKPAMDYTSAIAEQRGTVIARDVHGLEAPDQTIKTMIDPTDETGQRKLIVLESPYDERFDERKMSRTFTKDEYVKQLLASGLRGDKDLKAGNLGGSVLADVGTAGVFNKATGVRDYSTEMPSVFEMMKTNVREVPGDFAGKSPFWFSNTTADVARSMTADEFAAKMDAEVARTTKALESTIKGFNLVDPPASDQSPQANSMRAEKAAYESMLKRLKAAKGQNWKEIHRLHTSIAVKPDELLQDDETGKLEKPKTKAKPSGVKSTGGSRDTRTTQEVEGKSVVQRPRNYRMRGMADAPEARTTPGIRIIDAEKQFRAEQNSLRRQLEKLEKIKVVELKKEIKQQRKQSEIQAQINKMQEKAGRQIKREEDVKRQEKIEENKNKEMARQQNRIMKLQGAGMAAGMAASGAYMTGKTDIGHILMGVSVLATLGPMLKNPVLLMTTSLIAAAAVVVKFRSDIEKARKEGIDLANSMSMTGDKLQSLSELTGTVGATEISNRRRKDLASGSTEGQRQYGQNILESDFGKQIIKDIELQSKNNKTSKEMAQNLANNLAVAVAQGVVTTEQARSISAALGEKLGSYEIPALISGKLVSILGPNGENLKSNPLEVTLQIQKDSMKKQVGAFKDSLGAINILENTFAGAKLDMAPKSILDRFKNLIDPTTLFDYSKERNQSTKLSTAAVQLTVQEVAQNQGLVDSLNRQYDLKLKLAKTEAQIKTIEDERKRSLETLNSSNATALNTLIKQKDQLGENVFNKGIKAAADAMYKEGPMSVFKDVAIQQLGELKNSTFKTTLQVGLASGQVSPIVLSKILENAAGNKEFRSNFKLIVDKQGLADAALITELLPSQNATDTTRSLMLDYINTNEEDFDKDLQALSILNKINPTYGITLDLKENGVKQLQTTTNALKQIELLPDKLTKDVVANLAKEKPKEWQAFYDQWSILSEGEDFVNKNIKVAFDVISNDPNFKGFGSAAGKSGAQIIAKGGLLPTLGTGATELPQEKEKKKRDTTYDDILTSLKRTRDATIDTTKGAAELMRVLGGSKDLKFFKGIDQQLSKIGANSGFIDFVGGTEKAIQDKLIKINKKGVVSLTDLGEAFKKAYDAKQLGSFSAKSAETIKQLQGQRKGFVALKAAGASSADALRMVEDADFAVSLSKAKTSEQVKKLIKDYQNERKEIEKTLRANDPQAFLKTQMDVIDQKLDLDERVARRQYERETKAAEDQIDINNRLIKEAERKLEVDKDMGDRKVESINNQINALQRQISVEIESQQNALDAESRQLSEDNAIISNAVDAINKKYDEQEKALSKIYEINEDIAEQEKEKLGLADAITQGDISAAARAAQEIRARNAARSGELAQEMLGRARESEIAGVKGTITGKTSDQIAARQYEIERLSFALTTRRLGFEDLISKKQEEIYQIEEKRKATYEFIRKIQDNSYDQNLIIEKAQEALKIETDMIKVQRDRLTDLQLGIDKATQEGVEFTAELDAAYKVINKVSGLWDGLTDKTLKVTIQKIEETIRTGGSGGGTYVGTTKISDEQIAANNKVGATVADLEKSASPWLFGGSSGTAAPKYDPLSGMVAKTKASEEKAPAVRLLPGDFRKRDGLGLSSGGLVPKFYAAGGYARGTDRIPAMLTPGEFVIRKNAVDNIGVNNLNKINNGSAPGNSVYNYSVDINVANSDASSSDIARAVIGQIKYIDSQRIRGQR
jgi:hypothetical protein